MALKPEINLTISVKRLPPILVQAKTKPDEEFYFLSNIDQDFAAMVQTVYCFKPKEEHENSKNVGNVIKEALAKVLVHYYPFTGRLRVDDHSGKLIVKCTNEGVPFVEAEADCDIDALGDITIPDPDVLGNFVHTIPGAKNVLQMPLISVQVTRFNCGGFVLGLAINHIMGDGISAMEFINSWAETARGVPLTNPPFLDRRVLESRTPPLIQYPNNTYLDIDDVSDILSLYMNEQVVNESFYFSSDKILRLKNIASEDGIVQRCTSFTVLSALVWRGRSIALKMKPDQKTRLSFIVDARSRLKTPLPKGYFGNGIMLTTCVCTAGELTEKPLSFTVNMVQDAIERMDDEFIRSAIDYIEVNKPKKSFTATLLLSSWSRLPFNMANFGWGEPVKYGCATLPEKVMALFLSGGKDDRKKGVTLLLGLPGSAMKSFKELMEF